jgi:hypothetical protein
VVEESAGAGAKDFSRLGPAGLPFAGKEELMSLKLNVLVLFALAGAPGCGTTVAMTSEVVQREGGRMVYAAPREKVFKAVQEALDALNIGVSLTKPEAGLIVSKRFVLAAYATGTQHIATANEDTVQYDISIRASSDTQVEVTVAPRGYHNAIEVTDRPVWRLDGAMGQRTRWQQLFAEIGRMLGS